MKKMMMTLVALALAAPVMANPSVQLKFNRTVYGTGCKTVHFRSTNTPEQYGRDYTGTAGMYEILVNGAAERVFCIDLRQHATTATRTYEIAALQDAPRPHDSNPDNDIYAMNARKARDISELWAENINRVNDRISGAAFQLAIWEIVHEEKGADYDLTGGNGFWAENNYAPASVSYDRFASAIDLAQGWLDNLNGQFGSTPIPLRAYVSDQYQCFVGEGAVPAPGALLLSSMGTMLVGWIRRRNG